MEDVSDVITMLDEQTSYVVTIVAVNLFGAGPPIKVNVTTPARDTSELLLNLVTSAVVPVFSG